MIEGSINENKKTERFEIELKAPSSVPFAAFGRDFWTAVFIDRSVNELEYYRRATIKEKSQLSRLLMDANSINIIPLNKNEALN